MSEQQAECSVCGRHFEVRFSYQRQQTAQGERTYCSQACHERALFGESDRTCSVCGRSFELRYAYQQAVVDGEQTWYCSMACRDQPLRREMRQRRGSHVVAVMNQKGGTGKTTTTVSLAHGLARAGLRTLIVDMDAQGNVGASFGRESERNLYHVMVEGTAPEEAIINVRPSLDVLPSDSRLARVEVHLAHIQEPAKALESRFRDTEAYDWVLLDCGPSLSLLNQNAFYFADGVLVPVSCDYLSLLGVKQILKTLRSAQEQLRHPVNVMGVLPTFYDVRNRISHEVLRHLNRYFRDKVLSPIRINTRLKEAPSRQESIFEYAPNSAGAQDYAQLVEEIRERMRAQAVQPNAEPSGSGATPV